MLDSLLLLLQSSWPERATSGVYTHCAAKGSTESVYPATISHWFPMNQTKVQLLRRCAEDAAAVTTLSASPSTGQQRYQSELLMFTHNTFG